MDSGQGVLGLVCFSLFVRPSFASLQKRGYSPLCLSTACDVGQSSALPDHSFQFHDLIQFSQNSVMITLDEICFNIFIA